MIDIQNVVMLSCTCCVSCNGNGVIALRANKVLKAIDVNNITIGDALFLKRILGLSNSEAVAIFLGGTKHENI